MCVGLICGQRCRSAGQTWRVLADAHRIRAATAAVAVITAGSGRLVAVRMYETHHRPGSRPV